MRQKDIEFLADSFDAATHLAPADEIAGMKMLLGEIAKRAKYANDLLDTTPLLDRAAD